MPHLNNKQNKNTNSIISRQVYHLTQPCPSEEKQINKNSPQISPYTKLTQTTGPTLGGQKPKGRKNSTFFKERIQLSLKPGERRPQTQLPGASMRNSARGKGHEEGGSAYTKAGLSLRRPPVPEHLPPKPESAYFTALCSHLHL